MRGLSSRCLEDVIKNFPVGTILWFYNDFERQYYVVLKKENLELCGNTAFIDLEGYRMPVRALSGKLNMENRSIDVYVVILSFFLEDLRRYPEGKIIGRKIDFGKNTQYYIVTKNKGAILKIIE